MPHRENVSAEEKVEIIRRYEAGGEYKLMNSIQKSESIKAGLRSTFSNGTSKVAQRRCYGYDTEPDGELIINDNGTNVVRWIFDRYLSGDSFGKIASGLAEQGVPSPTGKPRWNRKAIDKLLSNEKYTGRVMLQKTISTGAVQIENDGLIRRYLYTGTHEAIFSDEIFKAVQEEKQKRSNIPENKFAIGMTF